MYELKLYANLTTYDQTGVNPGSAASQVPNAALHGYRAALLRGSLGKLVALLTGRKRSLLDLNAVVKDFRIGGRHHAGLQAVAIEKIIGSLGRSTDFDMAFNPLDERTRDRWLSVARARLLGIPLPPVELVQVGDRYFVRDGHHRISVARSFGEQAVDAEVTVWDAAGSLPWEGTRDGSWMLQAA
jgi:hypothetical protein